MPTYWKSGDQIVLREIWRGKVWSGRPCTVVEDRPGRLALFSGVGGSKIRACRPDGSPLREAVDDWELVEEPWTLECLRIVAPGSRHSVLLFWTPGFQKFMLWYVNLEEPMVRTPIGFDYLDRFLDIEIAPDLTRWQWKDEDEFQEAVAHGVLTAEEAQVFRAEGEEVIEALDARRPPFDERWDLWRPVAGWPTPRFPDGWDDLRRYPAKGGVL